MNVHLPIRSLIAALVAALSVATLFALPAAAAPPYRTIEVVDADFDFIDCGDFIIHGSWEDVRIATTVFRDSDGNVVRVRTRLQWKGIVFNASDPSKSLRDFGTHVIEDHFAPDGTFLGEDDHLVRGVPSGWRFSVNVDWSGDYTWIMIKVVGHYPDPYGVELCDALS